MAALPKKCDHNVMSKTGRGTIRIMSPRSPRSEVIGEGIGYRKCGGEWRLHYVEEIVETIPMQGIQAVARSAAGFSDVETKTYMEWTELSEVSLVKKSAAIKLLPELLREMEMEYDRRLNAVNSAHTVLDGLEDFIPTLEEGE